MFIMLLTYIVSIILVRVNLGQKASLVDNLDEPIVLRVHGPASGARGAV
jgi:hypothetical protein